MFRIVQDWEKILAKLLIVGFFLLNLSIASRSPFGGWMDEVSYADPGLNLAAGKGWVSTAYTWQTDREFFAGTPPLYAAGLAVWSRAFGISMVSSRAYCYLLAAVGMYLLWLGAYRFDLLTAAYRLFWIVLLSTEYAMNWMERDQRYDVWIFLGLALAWFGASARRPLVKYPAIFVGCFMVPFAGLIGVPYVFLIAGVAVVLTRLKFWKEAFAAVTGVGFGGLGLMTFFLAFGRLQAFRQCVSHMTLTEQSKLYNPYKILLYPMDDPSVGVMIVVLIALSLYLWRYSVAGSAPWVGLAWGMVILVPTMMVMRGVFVMIYFYMLIIPLSLAILQLVQLVLVSARGRKLALGLTVVMGLLCLGGLPARMYASFTQWDFRDPQHIRDFVRTYIQPGDAVISEYFFYFELRDYAKFVAVPFYYNNMPADEARQVNVAVLRDEDVPAFEKESDPFAKLGGGWKEVATFPTPEMRSAHPGVPVRISYTLYRREIVSP